MTAFHPRYFLLASVALLTMTASAAAALPEPIETLRFIDADGHTIALDSPGVLYLVDFWALECKPCVAEMPELDRLAKDYERGGRFRLVSVVWGGWSGMGLRSVAQRVKTTQPVYADPSGRLEKLTGSVFPTKLVIRDGMLLYKVRGGGPGAYDSWKTVIYKELKRSPVRAQP